MNRQPVTLQADAAVIGYDHRALGHEVRQFELALQALGNAACAFGELVEAAEVRRYGRHLAQTVPSHMRFEERSVLATMEKRGVGLRAFAQEMKRQHRLIQDQLDCVAHLLDQLDGPENLENVMADLRQQGMELVRQITTHVAVEERKFLTFSA